MASKDSANKPNLFSHPWLAVEYLRWNKDTHSEKDFYMSFRLFNVHSTGLLSIQKVYSIQSSLLLEIKMIIMVKMVIMLKRVITILKSDICFQRK